MGCLKNMEDYSKYECPFSHIEKECGHELHGPEGYENSYSIWCACGFRAPVFCLDGKKLGLKIKRHSLTDGVADTTENTIVSKR